VISHQLLQSLELAGLNKGELIGRLRRANAAIEALNEVLDHARNEASRWHLLADMRQDTIDELQQRIRAAGTG
jgi:predicted small metal-binding protein